MTGSPFTAVLWSLAVILTSLLFTLQRIGQP